MALGSNHPNLLAKMKLLRLLLIPACICLSSSAFAQLQTFGTEFWVGFTSVRHVSSSPADQAIVISARYQDAEIRISSPYKDLDSTFTVDAHTSLTYTLPSQTFANDGTFNDSIVDNGVHVTSDVPVQIYSGNYLDGKSDFSIVPPVKNLGHTYRFNCGNFKYFRWIGSSSGLIIVATADSTEIEIIPKARTLGGNVPIDSAYTIMLNQGQVYQENAYHSFAGTGNGIHSPGDLSGSMITSLDSCKKIVVLGGYAEHAYSNTCALSFALVGV